jgi:phosphate transport system ATP-binding protein
MAQAPGSIAVKMPEIAARPEAGESRPIIKVDNLSLYYGSARALKDISMAIGEKVVTAFIGPSGCGKSTLLRCFNRMNDLIDSVRIQGTVEIEGQDIYSKEIDAIELRKRVGMVFQK